MLKKLSETKFLNDEHYSKYYVCDDGSVYRFQKSKNALVKLNGSVNPDGYIRYDLRDRINKRGKCFFGHTLVAMAFLEYDGEIDHIDRNKKNNILSNLRKTTRSENNSNKESVERIKRKEYGKLVKEVVELREQGFSLKKISEKLGITYQQVRGRLKNCRV